MKTKEFAYYINLDRLSDVKNFVDICGSLPAAAKIQFVDESGEQRINATSLLGVLAIIDWSQKIRIESDMDIYLAIKDFIV